MAGLIRKIPLEKIYTLIPSNEKSCSNTSDLIELEITRNEELVRKRFFILKCSNKCDIHLTYALFKDDILEKAKKIYKQLPSIITKPRFYVTDKDCGLFGQDWFDGENIETILSRNPENLNDVKLILQKLKNEFSKIEKLSNKQAALIEFEEFKSEILGNTYLNENFTHLLKNFIFPSLSDELIKNSPTLRWTNGDLTAKNILVNKNWDFKLIDYEFSRETHFHREDWIRLAGFSKNCIQDIDFVKEQFLSLDPCFLSYFFLRQIYLNKIIHNEPINLNNISFDLNPDFKVPRNKNSVHFFLSNLIYEQLCFNVQLENELNSQINTNYKLDLVNKNNESLANELKLVNNNIVILEKKLQDEISKRIKLKEEYEYKSRKLIDVIKNKKNLELLLDKLSENIKLLENKKVFLYDKIYRMQTSFSWKFTQPFRLIRRLLIDPLKNSVNSRKHIEKVPHTYEEWIKKYDTITPKFINQMIEIFKQLEERPLISIIIPVFNPPPHFFEEAIKSIKEQIYDNWEICFADDKSSNPQIHKIIEKHVLSDSRIKIFNNEEHSHISVTSNNALSLAKGKFVVLMDHDDLLRPHSLLRLAQYYNKNKSTKIIYSDEDKIDESGNRSCPYFKPDWNPDLLLAQNYLCHLFCVETQLIKEIGGFRKGFEGSQDWDLILRLTEQVTDNNIVHIPEVLYHWRIHSGSTADNINNKNYAVVAAKKAVVEHLSRKNINASVYITQKQFLRVDRYSNCKTIRKASIIIPTKNNFELVKTCIESIFAKTPRELFEIILIDNQTSDHKSLNYYRTLTTIDNCSILNYDNKFNYSAINNFGAKHAKNEILVFLNDDTEIISVNWLQELMSQTSRPEIGAVGAKLFYPDGTIQHAGILLGFCTIAGEIMKGLPGDHPGQMQRANLVHNVSAITGACLAVEKNKFFQINGFDSINLEVAFNDVDFCLRLMEQGYKNLFTPEATLYHHESKSRGQEDTPDKKQRFEREINYMLERWSKSLLSDPNYNPNLSLDWQEQFHLAFPPRKSIFMS